MRKYRIAQIVPELLPVPPTEGGAIENWVMSISKLLSQDYHVSTFSRPSNSEQLYEIDHQYIPWNQKDLFFLKLKNRTSTRNPLRYLSKIQNVHSYAKNLAPMITEDFDIVHVHNEPNLIPHLRKRNKVSKIILHMHNDHLINLRPLRPHYRRILKTVDLILCVSDYIKNGIIDMYPETENRCHTLYNGTDTRKFMPYPQSINNEIRNKYDINRDDLLILYVGRLNSNKGIHVLIRSFLKIAKNFHHVRLVIVGSSWFREGSQTKYTEYLRRISEPVKSKITFTGFITGNDLYHLYSASDIFVSPSRWNDPSPLVLYEALSSGAAVICTNRGGAPEIVKHLKTGLVIEADDENLLAESIQFLFQHHQMILTFSRNGREQALKAYDWHNVAKNLTQFFDTIL